MKTKKYLCILLGVYFSYLELKEATLQSLFVHHPVVMLLCLQDAGIHLARQDTEKLAAINSGRTENYSVKKVKIF